MAKRPELVITNGPLAGQKFEIKSAPLRLGRSSSNDVHIPDEELSRNHCLFEPVGEDGIRLTDLASANGTYLNGTALGSDPVAVKEGDVIELGSTVVRVGAEPPPAVPPAGGAVDLGLGDAPKAEGEKAAKRRSPLANVLWAVVVLVAAGAIFLVLTAPKEEPAVAPVGVKEAEPVVRELYYERVTASCESVFRYELRLDESGALSVRIDDVPKENRHHGKSQALSSEAVAELNEILAWKALKGIDDEYYGSEPEPPALESWRLKVVYSNCAKTVAVSNTECPEAFRTICDKLEAFSKSELGVWAIQYPRETLIELSQQAVELGNAKWEDRDVNHGNLAASIAAFQEAIYYLETVNPKPDCYAGAVEGLKRSKDELDTRYKDQRFRADRALNLSQWDVAQRELQILLEMVPDRKDDRNRDAKSKLISAEKNLKQGGR